MNPAYIFDLDGTLSNHSHRLHIIEPEMTDYKWKTFSALSIFDPPHHHVLDLLRMVAAHESIDFYILTSRGDEVKEQTLNWLNMHTEIAVHYLRSRLYMRPEADYTHAFELKTKWVQDLRARNITILACFEDRAQDLPLWQSLNIPCFLIHHF